jgi:hypothetical protein
MKSFNTMRIGSYEFTIETASLRYVTQSQSGPGWDFTFSGPCVNDDPVEPIFPYGAKLFTEVAPLPLKKAGDLTGVELILPLPYDEESGEPFFSLDVCEAHQVSDVRLRFAERDGSRYCIEITGIVAKTVFGHPERLELSAWAEQLPDSAYPM